MQYYDDDRLLDKIEDYLRGKLPAQEAADFERQIAADPVLAETVDMMRVEQQAVELMFKEELRAKLEALEKSAPMSELAAAAQHRGAKRNWLLAALLAVLVAGGVWFLGETEIPPVPELPTETTKPKPDVPVAKTIESAPKTEHSPQISPPQNQYAALAGKFYDKNSRNRVLETTMRGDNRSKLPEPPAALAWMKSGYPEKAISALLKITAADGQLEYEAAQKLLAHAYFQDKRFNDASTIFRELAKKEGGRDEAQWLLLLCLVADYPNQRNEADGLLGEILKQDFPEDPSNNHPFLREAANLKKALADTRR